MQYAFPWGKETVDSLTVRSDLRKHLTVEQKTKLMFNKDSIPHIIQITSNLNAGNILQNITMFCWDFVLLIILFSLIILTSSQLYIKTKSSFVQPVSYLYYLGCVWLKLFWNENKWNNLQIFSLEVNVGRHIYKILTRNDAEILLCILIASKYL